jgi:hypothetical protein
MQNGKLSLKIYSKGECVLRIEVMIHNASETPFRRKLGNFPKNVLWMKEVAERFLNALYCMDVCFIGHERLECLPESWLVGKTRVGGVDINRPRMRFAIRAVLALSTSPAGFTAGQVALGVQALGGLPDGSTYTVRQAACDLRKLRGKQVVRRKGKPHRYESLPDGFRAMTALVVLRDDVIKPLLASQCKLKSGRPSVKSTPIDAHYATLRRGLRDLFHELGIAA